MGMGAARGYGGHRGLRQGGFTLLEILVVVAIIAMLALVVLVVPTWSSDSRRLDDTAGKLSDTLTALNEDSLFSGKLLALRLTSSGWTPLQFDVKQRRFEPAEGEDLKPFTLPPGLTLSWVSDQPDEQIGSGDPQQTVTLKQAARSLVAQDPFGGDSLSSGDGGDSGNDSGGNGKQPLPQVYFFPSGETSAMTFTLSVDDKADQVAKRHLSALGAVTDPVHDKKKKKLTAGDLRQQQQNSGDSLFNSGDSNGSSSGGFMQGGGSP